MLCLGSDETHLHLDERSDDALKTTEVFQFFDIVRWSWRADAFLAISSLPSGRPEFGPIRTHEAAESHCPRVASGGDSPLPRVFKVGAMSLAWVHSSAVSLSVRVYSHKNRSARPSFASYSRRRFVRHAIYIYIYTYITNDHKRYVLIYVLGAVLLWYRLKSSVYWPWIDRTTNTSVFSCLALLR